MTSKYKREHARSIALSMPRDRHGRFLCRNQYQFETTRQNISDIEQEIYKGMLRLTAKETRERIERINLELARCVDELDQIRKTLLDVQKVAEA